MTIGLVSAPAPCSTTITRDKGKKIIYEVVLVAEAPKQTVQDKGKSVAKLTNQEGKGNKKQKEKGKEKRIESQSKTSSRSPYRKEAP
jgi:hypothetical protein